MEQDKATVESLPPSHSGQTSETLASQFTLVQDDAPSASARRLKRGWLEAQRMSSVETPRVLEFLNRQPLKNMPMLGLIHDHGLVSAENRGAFYGCFRDGSLIGVALIGHWVCLSGSAEASPIFARVARFLHTSQVNVVLGEELAAREFERSFDPDAAAHPTSRTESQLLFAARRIEGDAKAASGLRRAEPHEVDEVAQVHAQACVECLGVNPLEHDAASFRRRVLSRIKLGRIWIIRDRDRRIDFKIDIASETEQAIYLEAVWTQPTLRGKGLGTSALTDLCQRLLRRRRMVCLFADADNQKAISFYRHIGFEMLAPYYLIRYGN